MKTPETQTHFWSSRLLQASLLALFVAFLIFGMLSGELTLIRIESSTL